MRIRFQSQERASQFDFRVGQFGIFSAFGYGESTFNICSSSNWKDSLEFCFRKVGRVTEALWRVEEGDTVGFRGPYGNGYPVEKWEGKNLIFLGGGIAMPPIRCAVWYALENREKYGDITIVYGARTVADLVYVDELEEWAKRDRVRVIQCVDPGGQTPEWKGEVGFVPTVFERAEGGGGEFRGARHRPAHHDQEHPADPGKAWRRRGLRLYQPRKPDEVRRGQVRTLQRRPRLRLQRRPRLHHGAIAKAAPGLLALHKRLDSAVDKTLGALGIVVISPAKYSVVADLFPGQ